MPRHTSAIRPPRTRAKVAAARRDAERNRRRARRVNRNRHTAAR